MLIFVLIVFIGISSFLDQHDSGSILVVERRITLLSSLSLFKAEVDDSLKRIQEHKGVQGCVIINNDGRFME